MDDLFKAIRTTPPELDKEQISQIVAGLPNLPPPTFSGLFSSPTKFLTMLAIISSAILGLLLGPFRVFDLENVILDGPSTQIRSTMQVIESQEENALLLLDNVEEARLQTEPIEQARVWQTQLQTEAIQLQTEAIELQSEATESDQVSKIKQTKPTRIVIDPLPASTKGNSGKTASSMKRRGPFLVGIQPNTYRFKDNDTLRADLHQKLGQAFTLEGNTYVVSDSPFRLSVNGAKKLKRMLWKQLSSHDNIPDGSSAILIKYAKEEVFIDGKKVAPSMANAYDAIFNQFQIQPGPNRYAYLYKNFIVVGDLDENYKFLRGVIQGKPYKGFKFGVFIDDDADANNQTKLVQIRECDQRVKFKGNIQAFKRNLIHNLKADDLITSAKPRVFVAFAQGKVRANKQFIPDQLQAKYKAFLAEFNITPCPIRIIEITEYYIAIGDVTDQGFKGRVNGRVDLKDLEYTLDEL